MYSSGDRASWLNAVAAKIMDGGTPPSIDYLNIVVPPEIMTKENDGHVTAAAALGEDARKDYRAGWRVIISEMVTLLMEQGFVGGGHEGLTWIKSRDGEWKVAMPDGPQMTVFGQRERRMDRDRSVVGERSEIDGSRVGVPSLFEGGRMHPFTLQVIGPRGGITEQSFELHPLAMAIPPMTEAERETLRKSIERDGVKVPIEIYQKKILDGRNRGYFASVFKKPVHIKIFEGTEDEARRHVAILNLHRRHLTTAQRYLAADNLFGEQAEKEAAIAQVRKPISVVLKTAQQNEANGGGKSHERAAKLATEAGIPVTPAGMRAIRELRNAPETRAKVERGEISMVAKAVAEARDEKRLPKLKSEQGVNPRSITKHLGEIIYHLNAVLADLEMPVGSLPDKISERLDQIEALAPQVRQALRKRKMIP